MAMTKGKRKQIFNLLKGKFDAQPKYKEVIAQLPDAATFPNANTLPSIHIVKSLEPIQPMTAREHESFMGFEAIGALMASDNLTLAQCDFEDEMEETIMSLQHDNDFLAVATQVLITQADCTPLSLAPLGIINPVLPPFGVVRITGHFVFYYEAFS